MLVYLRLFRFSIQLFIGWDDLHPDVLEYAAGPEVPEIGVQLEQMDDMYHGRPSVGCLGIKPFNEWRKSDVQEKTDSFITKIDPKCPFQGQHFIK